MKVLVTGAHGQLGQTLLANTPPGITMAGVDRSQVDITEQDQVRALVDQHGPDVIVNAAAYSAVDLAESNEVEATKANADGPQHLAIAARNAGARLVHLSTDFIFDGHSSVPYAPEAHANPLSAYGRSKREGEQRVRETLPDRSIILRTAWLYSEYGGNFVSTMLRLMRERDEISVVNDQLGSPTWARSVASAIFAFVARPALSGSYHWTDSGHTSWYDFACAIQEEAAELGLISKTIDIRSISSGDYPTAATRPAYSVLDCSATARDLELQQTPWRQSLRAMLEASAGR